MDIGEIEKTVIVEPLSVPTTLPQEVPAVEEPVGAPA